MIFTIGEILWDCFENEQILGGALLNLTYYLSKEGNNVNLISKIGKDNEGKEALEKIESLGINTDFIQIDSNHNTGKVIVKIKNNEPEYEIIYPSAWDFIENNFNNIKEIDYLAFGTLAQRNETSKQTIRDIWNKSKFKFYDVNIRNPFTTKELVLESLENSNIVKVNEFEIIQISNWLNIKSPNFENVSKHIIEKYNLIALCITCGKNGAYIITKKDTYYHKGFKTKVKDTVGAGDAFFAVLISEFIKGNTWNNILEKANLVASKVITIRGSLS